MGTTDKTGHCRVCGRRCRLTFHHLIPRKLHRRARFRKYRDRAALNRGIHVCRLCHSAIHRLYDEMTLAQKFDSAERLTADPAIRRHAAWAARQKIAPPDGGE